MGGREDKLTLEQENAIVMSKHQAQMMSEEVTCGHHLRPVTALGDEHAGCMPSTTAYGRRYGDSS